MIVSLLLILTGIGALGALLYHFAVYALPILIGLSAASLAYHSGAGPLGCFIIGALIAGLVLALSQGLFAVVRPVPLRLLILLAFALPAAYAGYCIVLQLTELGSLPTFWGQVFATAGAVSTARNAAMQLFSATAMNWGQQQSRH